jgi:hypothetical protein
MRAQDASLFASAHNEKGADSANALSAQMTRAYGTRRRLQSVSGGKMLDLRVPSNERRLGEIGFDFDAIIINDGGFQATKPKHCSVRR